MLFGAPAAYAALGAGPIGFVLLVAVLLIGTLPAGPLAAAGARLAVGRLRPALKPPDSSGPEP